MRLLQAGWKSKFVANFPKATYFKFGFILSQNRWITHINCSPLFRFCDGTIPRTMETFTQRRITFTMKMGMSMLRR